MFEAVFYNTRSVGPSQLVFGSMTSEVLPVSEENDLNYLSSAFELDGLEDLGFLSSDAYSQNPVSGYSCTTEEIQRMMILLLPFLRALLM